MFCSLFAPFFTLSAFPSLLLASSSKSGLRAQCRVLRGHVKKKEVLSESGLCMLPIVCPAWEPSIKAGGRAALLWRDPSGSTPFPALWSTRQAELVCTFPSAGVGKGKELVRRKYSCSRALLPSVRREHVRGGQAQKGRFRKRT